MRDYMHQYLNEIISLSVLLLMCLALISGEAGAMASSTADVTEPDEAQVLSVNIELSFRHQSE